MIPKYSKQIIEKVYKQDGVKVTRYAPVKIKPVPLPRVHRKPTHGPR
tara:strand:+ start:1329 stop:1469 length:141 start_codon:yes stop_codon:yes gene_type:complete